MLDRRTRDAHMHFARPRISNQLHERTGGRATDERIIDHDHPLSLKIFAQRIELQRDTAFTDVLRGFDERAADVPVLDQPIVERQSTLPCEADRGNNPRHYD